jgi:phosphoribosylglycinamide formyltransferase 1
MRTAALLSGGGSTFQALMDTPGTGLEFVAAISDRAEAHGLERARRAGIPTVFLDPADRADRADYGRALGTELASRGVELVLLAGFMRILDAGLVQAFDGRMLNIHPSLLPAFQGLHPHRQALSAGVQVHGSTVHFVTEELDGGPTVLQVQVPVLEDDDEPTLEARVKTQERRIYPIAARWFAAGRLVLRDGRALLDGEVLDAPVRYPDDPRCEATV